MANRNTLHVNHLKDFSKWLTDKGWKLEKAKGEFEVLRARKGKRFFPIYTKHDSDHLSFANQFDHLVRSFLKQRKGFGDVRREKERDLQ